MAATATVPKDQELEFTALSGSLKMMSKGDVTVHLFSSPDTDAVTGHRHFLHAVLNDVLDLYVPISRASISDRRSWPVAG